MYAMQYKKVFISRFSRFILLMQLTLSEEAGRLITDACRCLDR